MSQIDASQYILVRTGTDGPDSGAVAAQVLAAKDLELLHQGPSSLLVAGRARAVKLLASGLNGWAIERNAKVSM